MTPPGANTETVDREIARILKERLAPYMAGEREPALRNYYLFVWPGSGMVGARAKDQSKVRELERLMREEITAGLPDTEVFVHQGNLFGGFDSTRSIAFHLQFSPPAPQGALQSSPPAPQGALQSTDTEALFAAGRRGLALLHEKIPGVTVRPEPGLELAQPELRLVPNDQRILEAGWTRPQVAAIVRALGDGLYVGEHFDGEKRMNVILRSTKWETPEELAAVPLATPSGSVVQLGELLAIERTVGPTQLRRVDRRRTLTLNVVPPDGVSLEEALAVVQDEVAPALLAELPAGATVRLGGSADSLKAAVANMSENFLVALLVLFLLMSALFRSMKDSALVVLALPLATVGGVAALRLMNLAVFQPLDLLTMIGFIILLGLVVNNAILLVHQTRSAEREGADRRTAVSQALELRLRPIFMSTLTSIFGMLPLVLMPGAGSVIYRGLAVVIVGGMSVSTVFTLVLLPCLLRIGEGRGSGEIGATSASGLEQAAA
jgi:multidrug efflux pump subunit AcrB